MPDLPDYYAILQVHPTATRDIVDAAYRKLASKYHPDVNASAEAVDKMKLLNEAYEVLSDPDKRATYDRTRKQPSLDQSVINWNWRRLVVPAGAILVILIAARLGFRLALIIAVFLVIIWLLRRIGK